MAIQVLIMSHCDIGSHFHTDMWNIQFVLGVHLK